LAVLAIRFLRRILAYLPTGDMGWQIKRDGGSRVDRHEFVQVVAAEHV
jgi:hypothetical protein